VYGQPVTSETRFLPIFIVTKRKTRRNRVSRPCVSTETVTSETRFLPIFIVTKRKTRRNRVSRPCVNTETVTSETRFLPIFLATQQKNRRNWVKKFAQKKELLPIDFSRLSGYYLDNGSGEIKLNFANISII